MPDLAGRSLTACSGRFPRGQYVTQVVVLIGADLAACQALVEDAPRIIAVVLAAPRPGGRAGGRHW
jgi:hypothetical protein